MLLVFLTRRTFQADLNNSFIDRLVELDKTRYALSLGARPRETAPHGKMAIYPGSVTECWSDCGAFAV